MGKRPQPVRGEDSEPWDDYEKSIEVVRKGFSEEITQFLLEENIGYAFDDGVFHRKGRIQTRKNVEQATSKVLADPRLKPVSEYYVKDRDRLAQGKLTEALDWVQKEGLAVDNALSYLREYHHRNRKDTFGYSSIKGRQCRNYWQPVSHMALLQHTSPA